MKLYAALLLAVLALLSLASAAPREKRQWGPGYGGYGPGFGGRGYGPGYGNRFGPGGRWGGRGPTVIEKTVIIRPGK